MKSLGGRKLLWTQNPALVKTQKVKSKISKAAALMGSVKSDAKAKAARENGKKGGRPRWEMVQPGDKVQRGDEFLQTTGEPWRPVFNAWVGDTVAYPNCYRRKVFGGKK
jgi:hypothetical protein